MTVAKEPFTGACTKQAVKPLRRECRIASAALYARVRNFLQFAHEIAGAARIRHSLRPLFSRGRKFLANLGRNAPREREGVSSVIASAAKQSMLPHEERMDCLCARRSWRGPAGESPVRVGRSGRPVTSVAWSPATAAAKRTQ